MLASILALGAFWVIVHTLHARTASQTSLPTTRRPQPVTSTLSVSTLSLHFSTTRLNSLPTRILNLRSPRAKKTSVEPGRWRACWDCAALVGVVGVLVAQGVLLWAAWASTKAFVSLILGMAGDTQGVTARLVKRGMERRAAGAGSGASSLVLRPVIPGVTTPFSSLPLLLLALFFAQAFHELGHALSAACDDIPLLSTGVHLWVALPTFYVSLPSLSQSSALSELRIATAGVWHNLVLVGVVWLLSEQGGALSRRALSPAFRPVAGGVLVVDVDPSSPLSPHLSPNDLVTHLNDLELDSAARPALLWTSYLSSPTSQKPSYENLGWCLPLASFDSVAPSCCSATDPSSSELCFTLVDHGRDLSACLDPTPFLPPAKDNLPPRCLDNRSCGDGTGCARPRASERVLRIGVGGAEGEPEAEGRTVIWQGERCGVLRQVQITDRVPKWWWIPLHLLPSLETFYSNILSLSLALAFFNLLPLPHLDGSAIIHAFLRALSPSSTQAMEEGLRAPPVETGILAHAVGLLSRTRRGGEGMGEGERLKKGVKRWTIGVGVVLVACSVVVEVFGDR